RMATTAGKPTLFGEMLAEFLGTMLLIVLGDGVVAMVVLFGSAEKGGYTNITLGWGLAVTLAVYLTRRVSGGHLNPAVTLALAVFRDFPWSKVLPYCIAQVAGAFLGAALVFINYLPMFQKVDLYLEAQATTGIFTTFPAVPDAFWGYALFDQVV